MKAFIIPFPEQFNFYYYCPRGHAIVLRGLEENGVELVKHEDEADFIFLTYVPHHGGEKWNTKDIQKYNPDKLVIIDWVDEPDVLLFPKFYRYFKRSWVLPSSPQNTPALTMFKHAPQRHAGMFPFAYCAMKEFFQPQVEKTVEFGCYLRPTCPNRFAMCNFAANACNLIWPGESFTNNDGKVYIGAVSGGSRSIGNELHFDEAYLSQLAKTNMLLTCNPTWWEGDSRLWEAMANGCCVFTDKLYTPYPNPLKSEEHFFEYTFDNSGYIADGLDYGKKNLKIMEEVGANGKAYVLQYHTEKARMQYVLNNL